MDEKITPAQQQYQEIKKKYADALLFFRMGDFYEMFGEDAKVASNVLGLTLTSRDRTSPHPIPMAGVPYHSVNKYIAQLSQKGFKVAICEQLSDPSLPGIVERDVVRVITPGTVVEDEMLDQKRNNYIVGIAEHADVFGVAMLDISTGDFSVTECSTVQQLKDELYKLSPAEIVFPKNAFAQRDIVDILQETLHAHISWYQMFEDPTEKLISHFHVKTLKGFGIEHMETAIQAAGCLLAYVQENEKIPLSHIICITPVFRGDYMHLDESTIRHLELIGNAYDGKKEGSLLGVLDRTETSMGARLLYQWLLHPLLQKNKIEDRLDVISFFLEASSERLTLRQSLKHVVDIERIIAKMVFRKAWPKDLLSLKETIGQLPTCQSIIQQSQATLLQELLVSLQAPALQEVYHIIDASIDEDAVSGLENGGTIIKKGFNTTIDELRSLVYEGKDWIVAYQKREQERTGITNLKVGFNKIFGYFLEVSKGQLSKIPGDFIRKQTLVNAERFITEELKQYEQKVLGAEEKLLQLEREEFLKVQESLYPFIPALKDLASALATIDVLVGFATLAFDQKYCRPVFAEHKGVLTYTNGRHPVVEKFLSNAFVGNDLHLDKEKYIMLLTGPNMAGKSTYLRQTALIILMAHIGSFVPASSCVLDIFDRIFTRIGASDVLIKGQSTFLVEMQETANILNNATEKSFIILDEVGRGTSTYDGLSLAWSILEYLHHHTKAKVLFATHYHELIQVAESLPGAFNASMAVTENTDGVVFLRKVVPGGVDKSYGIEVAKISALPSIVIERAKEVLSLLEAEKEGTQKNTSQLSFLEPHIIETVKIVRRDSDIEKKIESLNLNDLTPIEALNLLWEMRKDLKKK